MSKTSIVGLAVLALGASACERRADQYNTPGNTTTTSGTTSGAENRDTTGTTTTTGASTDRAGAATPGGTSTDMPYGAPATESTSVTGAGTATGSSTAAPVEGAEERGEATSTSVSRRDGGAASTTKTKR